MLRGVAGAAAPRRALSLAAGSCHPCGVGSVPARSSGRLPVAAQASRRGGRAWAAPRSSPSGVPCSALPTRLGAPKGVAGVLSPSEFFPSVSSAVCGPSRKWATAWALPPGSAAVEVSSSRRAAPASELFLVRLSVPVALARQHTLAGQYVQIYLAESLEAAAQQRPLYLALASPPLAAGDERRGSEGALASSAKVREDEDSDGVAIEAPLTPPASPRASDSATWELLVRRSESNETSKALCDARVPAGLSLFATPPPSRGFDLRARAPADAYPHVLLLAAGSGIAPILSALRQPGLFEGRTRVELFYGARARDATACVPEVRGMLEKGVLQDLHLGWTGEGHPRVPAALRTKRGSEGQQESSQRPGTVALAAGPPGMLKDVQESLADIGVDLLVTNF